MKTLQPVNVHTVFCRGCGIAPAPEEGRECPTCYSIASHVWNVMEPMPIKVHIAFALALAVFIAGIVIALRI